MKKILAILIIPALIFVFWPGQEENTVLSGPPKTGHGPQPNDWLFRQRAYPSGAINGVAVAKAELQAADLGRGASKNAISWELVAPNSVPGRVTNLALGANNRLYLGTPVGGLWASDDMGENWRPMFEEKQTISVGALAIAPSNKSIIYLGTGDANGSKNSVWYAGAGVYRSDDAGESWLPMGLEESRYIGRIAVDPGDPNLVYAGAMGAMQYTDPNRGLYRSRDGGLHWEKVLSVSEGAGVIDVIVDPTRPMRIYAASWERIRHEHSRVYSGPGSMLHRSLDGGDSWTVMTNGLPPVGELGRMGITVSPSHPDTLYAIFNNASHDLLGVYKSVDGGDAWTALPTSAHMDDMLGGFGWYFGQIRVHPTDPDLVFALGVTMFFSHDGGQTWEQYERTLSSEQRADPKYDVHVDYHDLIFSEQDPNLVLVGNDGGTYRTLDDAFVFTAIPSPPNAQFYTTTIDPSSPSRFFGGLQDNGTQFTYEGATTPWNHILGGDGFVVLVDPTDPESLFVEYQYGHVFHLYPGGYYPVFEELDEGDNFEWKTPMMLDPNDPNTVYVGSQRLWRASGYTPDNYPFEAISGDLTKGTTGPFGSKGALTAIAVAPSESGVIYVGTNDGNVWITVDDGATWKAINETLPNRWVTSLAVDSNNKNTAYVTFSGYYDVDYQPHILKTTDAGATWTDISGNLPEAPINDVLIDPTDNHTLYIASEFGVYVTRNAGASWIPLGVGLPRVTVTDLDIHAGSGTMTAATYGRSMYKIDLNQARTETGPRGTKQDFRYTLAQLGTGNGEETRVAVVNPGDQSLQVDLFGFSRSGEELASQTRLLGPRQRLSLLVSEAFPGQAPDWLQVGASQPLLVMAELMGPFTSAAYLASSARDTLTYLPHVARDTVSFETVLASVNTTNEALDHRVRQNLDEGGSPIYPHLTPYTQVSADARDFLGANLEQTNFARLEANTVGAASMEYFTTLPERDNMAALGLDGRTGTNLYFLHVAADNLNFWTGLVYINVGESQAAVEQFFYDKDGNLLEGGVSAPLESGGKVFLVRDQTGSETLPEETAWVEIRADQQLVGYELFGSNPDSDNRFFAGLQAHYETGSAIDFAYLRSDEAVWTGLVAVNLGQETADLGFIAYDDNGVALETKTMPGILPKVKLSVAALDLFSPETLAVATWIRAEGATSKWAGFQLWGDRQGPIYDNMAGVNAVPVK